MEESKKAKNGFSFLNLSIQQRLPLLICILLLVVIVIFSWTSYLGVKNASLEVGRNRLHALTGQLSTMFQQSAQALGMVTRASAEQEPVKKYLQSGSVLPDTAAQRVLEKLRQDTTTLLVELLNAEHTTILRSAKSEIRIKVNIDSTLAKASVPPAFSFVGKIYPVGDSMYFPIVAAVTDDAKKPIGYIVRWRLLKATPTAIEQLAQLIGTKATIYFGNDDRQFWTDMIGPVSTPPIDKDNISKIVYYSRKKGEPLIAAAQPVSNTNWLVLVEFSQKNILDAAHRFLGWIIIIGAVLIVFGIFIAWLMSRNITKPLNKLSAAASAIAGGDYSSPVEINRYDELGKLARAFNSMAVQVSNAQQNLEKKVQERTAQLEIANKELEAFSYSVSHDLRAPLRVISGYSMILKEDYGIKLDAEGNRITNTIIANANMMGQLIDDLIAFSKAGKKDSMEQLIDMMSVAETCMDALIQHEPAGKYTVHINPLPDCTGDENLIKQVWTNLISNAIKYSSKAPNPQIEIGWKENGGQNIYFIRDNGVGFDMQYAHKLFGVFQRLHNKEAFEGNGIGLALVKRIIEKHKGEIWAEASPGNGAVFYFSLTGADNDMAMAMHTENTEVAINE